MKRLLFSLIVLGVSYIPTFGQAAAVPAVAAPAVAEEFVEDESLFDDHDHEHVVTPSDSAGSKSPTTNKQADDKAKKTPPPEVRTAKDDEELKKLLAKDPTPPVPIDPAVQAKRTQAIAAEKKKRTAQIKKLQFDRRTSTALRIWSTPPEDEKKDKEKGAAKSAASDANPAATTAAAAPATAGASADPFLEKIKVKAEEFQKGIAQLQKDVTLGNWEPVKEFVASLEEDESKALYAQMLTSLSRGPGRQTSSGGVVMSSSRGPAAQFKEKNQFSIDDVFGIIAAAPTKLEKTQIATLGSITSQMLTQGYDFEDFQKRLRDETKKETEGLLDRRQAALLLFAAGRQIETGEFLPSPEEAQKENDREGLNLISRQALAEYAKEKKKEFLMRAWSATQAALAVGEIDKAAKAEALQRAVDLAPKIKEEFGKAWLDESFTKRLDRGKEILATIGSSASTNMMTRYADAQSRLKILELQKTAVDALLAAAPDKAKVWKDQLTLLANNWLREADFSYKQAQSSSYGSRLQRDLYGNYYYLGDEEYSYNRVSSRTGSPIGATDVIDNCPSDQWLAILDASIKPRFHVMFAQLFLKVNEEDLAFPFIEQFAKEKPDQALELAHEFLRVWTRNHDPNANRRRTSYYMFSYGYNQRADHIPLTRSKQERNLKELSEWVRRLRALPIGDLDQKLLVSAFQKSHSSAEVYRLDAIESVFGSVDSLEPKTVAEMLQSMRGSLVGIWRDPATQKQNNTKRKKADMQAEVLRGYQVAREVLEKALEKTPDEWRLILAKACLQHDENDYRQSLAKSSDFSKRRDEAMALFAQAAEKYKAMLADLPENEETTEIFDYWYYSSLGAVDLGRITEDAVPDLRQPARIRAAIESFPGETAERHMAQFANKLFTRMSSIKPEMKYRYLRTGFEIVGDHKRAHEAKKVFEYYNDLVTEIKLEAEIDGSSVVGHKQPFGVWVNLVHTKEIERESGGFSKYLQNQNNMYYSYNYGRPTENYRDKFQEAATKALDEHFEVLSVTFNDPQTQSSALPKYGWRVTPYAYILLKPRGPEVDKIPELQIDLDFLDTSGYAIIPVSSSAIPIDASKELSDEQRPFKNLTVTQTLDERQASEGKLIVEVKASANGLVPELDDICTFDPEEFDVANIEDQGVSVSRFDQEIDETAIISERIWLVSLEAKKNLTEKPSSFVFPVANIDDINMTFQRYVDEDLEEVDANVSLVAAYGTPRRTWPWALGGIVLSAIVLFVLLRLIRKDAPIDVTRGIGMPSDITPFTVIGLLKEIQHHNGMSRKKQEELAESITSLERHYFMKSEQEEPDLRRIAETWLRQSA